MASQRKKDSHAKQRCLRRHRLQQKVGKWLWETARGPSVAWAARQSRLTRSAERPTGTVFSSRGSKTVTAYKKRRKADRNRVEKKFFVDNGLPAPQPEDIAANDAGLPRARTSARATFVEQWCKFGSFAICKQCRSLQPRPLEPIDTRRVAPVEMTAKACKQCRAGQWVPQPEDIPRPLKKLSVKLSKVLRPLDIHVGPEKKAANGYRHHATMFRMSWSKRSVQEKISKAGPQVEKLYIGSQC